MAVYGFRPSGTLLGVPQSKVVTNGAAATAQGDIVNLVAGVATIVTAGDFCAGVAKNSVAISATTLELDISPFLKGYMANDNDSTTFASTHVGYGFDIIGATGAMLVDTNTCDNTQAAPTGLLSCLEYNPQEGGYASDTSIGLFVIVENQFYQRNI